MNIILIGFMGSGKSSVAALLAEKLKWNQRETDTLVLARSGRKSIKEIFLVDGEIQFREMEIEVAKGVSVENNSIISTGGGMILNKISIDYLKKNGRIVFLSASFEEIERRLEGDNNRPLFADKQTAEKLFKFRKKIYEQYADIKINTDNKSIDEITNIILKKI